MLNKKIQFILFIFITLMFIIISVFWSLSNDKPIQQTDNNRNIAVEKNVESFEEKMKRIFPDIIDNQLEMYENGNISNCENNNYECLTILSVIHEHSDECGEIGDTNQRFDCYNIFYSEFYPDKIEECSSINLIESEINCLSGIFQLYNQVSDCMKFENEIIKNYCIDNVNFKISISENNKELCNNILDIEIKKECVKDISEREDLDDDGLTTKREIKFGTNPLLKDTDNDGISDGDELDIYITSPILSDTDNDGLNDLDEIKKYKTSPIKADTDGDGFNDGDEVKAGYNPNGPGLLKQ